MLAIPAVNSGSAVAVCHQNVGGLCRLSSHTAMAALQSVEAFLVIRGYDCGLHGVIGSKGPQADELMS